MVGIRAKDHDEKRRLILEKSAELFGDRGFHRASIAEISKACGASKAWIFHYFPNKESILYALLHDFFSVYNGRIREAVAKQERPEAKLKAFVSECISVLLEYRINYAVLFNELKFLPAEDQRRIRLMERESVQLLGNVLLEVNPAMKQRQREILPTTFIVMGGLLWTYTWYDPSRSLSEEDLAELVNRMIVAGIFAA
jgi:AcrR family transcriptional regulator